MIVRALYPPTNGTGLQNNLIENVTVVDVNRVCLRNEEREFPSMEKIFACIFYSRSFFFFGEGWGVELVFE